MAAEKTLELIQYVQLGLKEAAEELLAKSPDLNVNTKDEDGNVPAVIAAKRNDLPTLKFLVQHGANLTLKDGFGRNAMGWAERHKNKEMIEFIQQELSKISKTSSAKSSEPTSPFAPTKITPCN